MNFTGPKEDFPNCPETSQQDSFDEKTVILETHTMRCWNGMHAHEVIKESDSW